jgi:2-polyprenyl-3-methyl-5-hydroxy-6-metoxy-1,4-benzoquinol methylase
MTQIYGKIFKNKPLSQSHLKIISLVGFSKDVLELGCSTGYITERFQKNRCNIDVVEIDKNDADKAKKYARKVYIGSVEDKNLIRHINKKYDFIIAADILEHLKNPEVTLDLVKSKLKKDGSLIISIPNIACWKIRKDLFFRGIFDYQDFGILDKTHLKFFTYFTIQKFLKENKFIINNLFITEVSYPFKPKITSINRTLDIILGDFLTKYFPNLSCSHLVIVSQPKLCNINL